MKTYDRHHPCTAFSRSRRLLSCSCKTKFFGFQRLQHEPHHYFSGDAYSMAFGFLNDGSGNNQRRGFSVVRVKRVSFARNRSPLLLYRLEETGSFGELVGVFNLSTLWCTPRGYFAQRIIIGRELGWNPLYRCWCSVYAVEH